jgi:hypothetical protein
MQAGMRVRYTHEDTEYDKRMGFFPPIGTLGTVEKVDPGPKGKEQILVQWDSGTIGDGKWWCYWTDVEIVEEEE